ncbi:hypothetical protein D3C78_721050 [compost metagenome]
MQDGFDFLIHQRLDFVAAGIADDDETDIVTDERGQFLVLQDRRRALEDRGFLGIVDMGLDLVARFRAQIAHQRIKHAEHVEIVSLLRDRMLEGLAERLARILHDLHGVCHDEAAEAGAANDHQFERLNQHVQMTAHRHIAADDAAEGDYKSNYNIH